MEELNYTRTVYIRTDAQMRSLAGIIRGSQLGPEKHIVRGVLIRISHQSLSLDPLCDRHCSVTEGGQCRDGEKQSSCFVTILLCVLDVPLPQAV